LFEFGQVKPAALLDEAYTVAAAEKLDFEVVVVVVELVAVVVEVEIAEEVEEEDVDVEFVKGEPDEVVEAVELATVTSNPYTFTLLVGAKIVLFM